MSAPQPTATTAVHTHSLEDAARQIVGAGPDGQPLPGAVFWVQERLRRGEFTGYKAARRWRMTDADIQNAIESLRPRRVEDRTPRPATDIDRPLLTSMTRTSRRRLAVGQ